jgi:hypothetical protein
MKITNVEVHGLEDAILASGFAFRSDFDPGKISDQKSLLRAYLSGRCGETISFRTWELTDEELEWCEKQVKRLKTLGSCEGGESHDCALCGITVSFDMTCPRLVMPEVQRYHFMDIVTASSTMHCLKKNVNAMLADESRINDFFCDYTDHRVVKVFLEVAKELLDKLPDDKDKWDAGTNETVARLKAILPEGYLQTTHIVTNYRQLKTWVRQRSNHPLQEWRDVCKWIHTLPFFDFLTEK